MLKRRAAALLVAAVMCFTAVPSFAVKVNDAFKADSVVEAEHGSVRSSMIIASDGYSSGGRFLTAKSNGAVDAAKIGIDDVSYLFDIDTAQKYVLYARVYSSSAKPRFWFRWNRGTWTELVSEKDSNYAWVKVGEAELTEGNAKLEISRKDNITAIDCFYLASDEEALPPEIENVQMREAGGNDSSISQEQTEIPTVTGGGIVFEAEQGRLSDMAALIESKECSGGRGVYITKEGPDRNLPESNAEGAVEIRFNVEKRGSYIVYARILAPNSGADSGFIQVGEKNSYGNFNFASGTEYAWLRCGVVNCEEGEECVVRFRPREAGWTLDQIVVVSGLTYLPSGIVSEIETEEGFGNALESPYDAPPYNPPANEHPRVYFRESDIPQLLEKVEAPENESAKNTFVKEAEQELVVGTAYSEAILQQIMSKALYYQLYKDADKGREAVEGMIQLTGWTDLANAHDNTRRYGACIEALAIVYDWCYDLTTEQEKIELVQMATGWAMPMEIGWPPNKQGSLVGHGAEAQLLRDDMALAIATYDERPDIWSFVGGYFYQSFVPERQWHLTSQLNHQGNCYGQYRNAWSCWGWLLITGMGAPEPYSGYLVGTHAYSHSIYTRRPDGSRFLSGDMYTSGNMVYSEAGTDALVVGLACSKDPLIKDELMRVSQGANGSNRPTTTTGVGAARYLIFSQPQIERASRSNMSNSYYFESPMGVMYARTGWDEGVDSNVAVAEMKVGEYWFGNHQHKDFGTFQLYYKGPLATESGFYEHGDSGYGTEQHMNYTNQTIAHNGMLVYDPNEDPSNFINKTNDGGQRWPNGIQQTTYENILKYPEHKPGEVEGEEIDPQNPKTPDYTYLKGDITNAYSEKVSDYKRSFMFLDFKEDDVPAALIVFDKLSTPNPSLEKTWLLHGQSDPTIKDSRLIWKSSPYTDADTGEKYTGKMVHDVLLPASGNYSMKIASGPELGWETIRGVKFDHPQTSAEWEENTYRLELSPTTQKETEYFLNVMQVTDEDNTKYYTPKLVENSELYGVQIKDRIVMFSKSGKRLSKVSDIKASSETLKYTVCDMEAGTYKISGGGEEQTAKVSEKGGVLSFTAAADSISIERVSDETVENKEIRTPEGNEKTIIVKKASTVVGLSAEPEIVNGKLMVPAQDLAVKIMTTGGKRFLKEVYSDKEQQIEVILRPDSDVMTINGRAVKMDNKTYYKNDKLMVELRAFAEAFNWIVSWDDITYGVYLTPNRQTIVKTEEGYIPIKSVTPDDGEVDAANLAPNVADSNLSTLWAANGAGRYIDIELEREAIIENIEIIFNPNNNRTPYFDVEISADGENYEKIYTGIGSSEADGKSWEVFKFDPRKEFKTKYIRYVANGSNKSMWNGVKEIRIKEGTEMTVWDMTDEYVNIINALPDGGEVDASNTADNLIDSNSRTIWAAQGIGRYVDFELEAETEISGLDIVFNPNSNRTAKFTVSVSNDGVNYTQIYEGKSDPNAEKEQWESFDFGKKVKAKYVRYTGNGSNISLWNGVNEIRVKK